MSHFSFLSIIVNFLVCFSSPPLPLPPSLPPSLSTIAQPDAETSRLLIQSTTVVIGVAPEVPRPRLPLL